MGTCKNKLFLIAVQFCYQFKFRSNVTIQMKQDTQNTLEKWKHTFRFFFVAKVEASLIELTKILSR